MRKIQKLTLPLLALSSSLLLSGVVAAAEDKKAEPAPAPAPAAAPPAKATPAPAAAPPAKATPAPFTIPDPVAVVNGTSITKAAFDQYAQQLRGKAKVDSAEASKSLVDQLVMEELLVQEANKQKLAEDPQVKQQLAMVERNLLASTVVRKMLSANAPSEEAIQKEYDTAIAAMKGKEYKASHILVDSEDKAKEVIAELQKGGNFAELAKTKSSDSSAANGGDLGWFTPSMMVPPFAEAVAKMEKGKYSEQPVQTPFGWHVILLEDIRDATPPSMEELKPQITQMLQSRMVNDYLEKLKAGAKIEIKAIQVSEAKPAAPEVAAEEETKADSKEAAKAEQKEEKKEEKK
jgi:peptidyl-prolyl cis-trans isomerase C